MITVINYATDRRWVANHCLVKEHILNLFYPQIYIKRKIADRIYLYLRIYRKIKITRHICVFKNTLGYMYIITYENPWAYMRL